MHEHLTVVSAIAAGASCGVTVLVISGHQHAVDAATWLARRSTVLPAPDHSSPTRWSKVLSVEVARDRWASVIDRAGWNESPERVAAFGLALAICMAVLGLSAGSTMQLSNAIVMGALGFVIGIGVFALVIRSAVATRRRRLAAELVPLLELFTLELSGGGSALSALDSVTGRVQGELAADIRRLLVASQVAGSIPFEVRLMQYSDHLDLAAVMSLATMLASSREYGTGVVHGVRALARDLRQAQRRELIAHSRRALNHVLIPAAVGVLLPFLAVVMFPAVTALQQNLH